MKNVVSFSGGRTSAYLCYLMKEKYGDDVELCYQDTGAEHPKTYEFIRKVNKEFNLNLTCLRVKINPELGKGNSYDVVDINDIKPDLKPFKDIMSKYGTPYYPSGAFCSDFMKANPCDLYLNDKYGKGNWKLWLGIRIDEPKRLKNTQQAQIELFEIEKKKGGKGRSLGYMAEISDFEKQDVLDWWEGQPFNLEIQEPEGNCMFCIKKGINKVAYSARLNPDAASEFIKAVNSKDVRITDRVIASDIMYRGGNSLASIIEKYKEFSTDEIAATIRSVGGEDTGSCSESCEAFSPDSYDLFSE